MVQACRLRLGKTADSAGIGEIRSIRGQKRSVAAIFFVTRHKFFGRNISERLELKTQ
jgi:hypothetical protein